MAAETPDSQSKLDWTHVTPGRLSPWCQISLGRTIWEQPDRISRREPHPQWGCEDIRVQLERCRWPCVMRFLHVLCWVRKNIEPCWKVQIKRMTGLACWIRWGLIFLREEYFWGLDTAMPWCSSEIPQEERLAETILWRTGYWPIAWPFSSHHLSYVQRSKGKTQDIHVYNCLFSSKFLNNALQELAWNFWNREFFLIVHDCSACGNIFSTTTNEGILVINIKTF